MTTTKESMVMRCVILPALAGVAFALGGCGPVNRGLESVNQPVVSRTDYVLDVSGEALRSGSLAEAARIDAWFDALGLGYGDRVAVDDPAGPADPGVRDAVSTMLARRGLLLSGATPATAGGIAPGHVRLVVSHSEASVPDCPNWRRASHPEFASSTMSNYGCATNGNLAAMIADPEDLVRGVSSDTVDSRSVSKAIRAYRDAPPSATTGLRTESTKATQ
ncbi:MAG: CpaD family pilus assembly protein [Sphingomonas sp.]